VTVDRRRVRRLVQISKRPVLGSVTTLPFRSTW
jgi:hypothetical protein